MKARNDGYKTIREYLREAADVEIVRCPDSAFKSKSIAMRYYCNLDRGHSFILMRHDQAKKMRHPKVMSSLLHELGHATMRWNRLSSSSLNHAANEIMADIVGYACWRQLAGEKYRLRHSALTMIGNLPSALKDVGFGIVSASVLMQAYTAGSYQLRVSDVLPWWVTVIMTAWLWLWTGVLLILWRKNDKERVRCGGKRFKSFRLDGLW